MATVHRLLVIAACACGCRKQANERTPPPIAADAAPSATADVMLVVDLSRSMEETDLAPDRLEATRRALRTFVAAGGRGRTGMVIFAQTAKVIVPLTADEVMLDVAILHMQIDDVPSLGTAIGDGLGLAVDELPADSTCNAVVLLADGDNNMVTRYDPAQAATLARDRHIVVHTLLVGTEGQSSNPKPLEDIAAATGGTFHRVTDAASFDRNLREVGDTVARMPGCRP